MPKCLFGCKGEKMNFKTTVPYALIGMGLLFSTSLRAQNNKAQKSELKLPRIEINVPQPTASTELLAKATSNAEFLSSMYHRMDEIRLDMKAEDLVQDYIGNMLTAQAKLNPLLGTRAYRNAVRRELPGAPVGAHCVYGQYTQLQRALDDKGDTLTIVPKNGSRQCIAFKSQMRKKYGGAEYEGAIREGRMFETAAAYEAALEKYAASQHIAANAPDSVLMAVETRFAQKNFSATEINPGTMLVVPRHRGSKNTFHMIMFLGYGRVEGGKFVPDENGRPVYAGHNRETLGYLFDTYDTTNVFAADTRVIARAQYAKEWAKIAAMSHDQLVDMLAECGADKRDVLARKTRNELLHIVRTRYFKEYPIMPREQKPTNIIAMYNATQQLPTAMLQTQMQRTI